MTLQQWIAAFLLGGIEDAMARGAFFTRPFVYIWPLRECLDGEWEE